MAARIRTLNFLPEVFQTPTNTQFLSATLDQLVDQPNVQRIQGYVGSRVGYGVNANDYYVTEPTKVRTDYQLDPGVVFTKPNETIANDFISYPGMSDALTLEGGITNNNNRLYESQFYSWDSFSNLDKLINYNQYYWIPEGPERVIVASDTVYSTSDYMIKYGPTGYEVTLVGSASTQIDPTIILLRGGTYRFFVNQESKFWIQGVPGVTGYDPSQPNMQTRDVYGVSNNGVEQGIVTFNVPSKNAQNQYDLPGNNLVGVVSKIPFSQLNGAPVKTFNGIDGVTSLNGLTVLFYNTGVTNEVGYVSTLYSETNYDYNNNLVANSTINVTSTDSTTNAITCSSTTKLTVGQSITFSGVPFGGLQQYTGFSSQPEAAGTFTVGQVYNINTVGTTDWISLGVLPSANVEGSISGTKLTVSNVNAGSLEIGQTITGDGILINTIITQYNPVDGTYELNQSQTVASTTISGYEVIPGKIFTANDVGTGTGTATPYKPEIFYVNTILSDTQFTISDAPCNAVQAGSFVIGDKYVITSVGTTNFTTCGASSNTVGVVFTATNVGLGTGSVCKTIPAGSLIYGKTYTITSLGTTDFTSIGASSNTVGLSFIATGSGSGTGTVILGAEIELSTSTGSMTAYINQGLYEEGYYTNVNQNFFRINYVGTGDDAVMQLVPAGPIPTNQKITATFGTEFLDRSFFKNEYGQITLIPYISAPLDTLYYQDGSQPGRYGVIKLIETNLTNTIDVENSILGKEKYTSPNGVVFTNGLKVSFQGDVKPASYKVGEYYIDGVGSAIQLIPVDELISPEPFTASTYIPWDTVPWGMGNWEGNSYIPVDPDYITIRRGSVNRNAWSRGNRWFHIDVIKACATYNNNPNLVTLYATSEAKAKRPIIEFYPNLKLFENGSVGKSPIDFIDFRTTDAFTYVAGQINYYPDVTVYTGYNATIDSTVYPSIRHAFSTNATDNSIECNSITGFSINDLVIFNNVDDPVFGGLVAGKTYYIANFIDSTHFTISTEINGDEVTLSNASSASSVGTQFVWHPRNTQIVVSNDSITGVFQVGQYVKDTTNLLPRNCQISAISKSTTTTTLTISYTGEGMFPGTTVASIVATDTPVDNYALYDGARVVFAADENENVRNKIYVTRFSYVNNSIVPIITLTEADDGLTLPNEQTVAFRGYNYQGKDFYFDGVNWIEGQQKTKVNQPPLFDIFDENGISFGDPEIYVGTNFKGNKLFSYALGSGTNDSVLGIPLQYSSIDNVGDINFDVTLNTATFNYVSGSTPITQNVNTGFVYNYSDRTTFNRMLGWQTAIDQSVQYQAFIFNYDPVVDTTATFTCDIPAVYDTKWPVLKVFVNNNIQPSTNYTYTVTDTTTKITLTNTPITETTVEILVLSNSVSKTGYYVIPDNLNNNPLNENLATVNVGEIRGQYQSMFYNNPDTTGEVFGPNNFRDLGNLVPWGNKIIQNSASLVLSGAMLRKQEHNLFYALSYNRNEYIKFKSLLVDTVNLISNEQNFNPATVLDNALDYITSSKTESQPFFWSDMLPSKAPYKSQTYRFANTMDLSIYPLTRVYDFTEANYYGVLVYLMRTEDGLTFTRQLFKDIDYVVSKTSPSLEITIPLQAGDQVTVNEYYQTYGSYVPNTPTKLGLYPASIPSVVLDSDYSQPTYFILGHDGSYTKLYGSYNPITAVLTDFRDQALLEFETRIYNNLKLSSTIPIQAYEVVPGYFRQTQYSLEEYLEIYTPGFLNWVGQNRVEYKQQYYIKTDEFTYNYYQSGNKLDKKPIYQGFWRGIYNYLYDTTTPNLTPWEMLGFTNKPSWWEGRYGKAPYTSDNLVLWGDLELGLNWNNGKPYVIPKMARPGLVKVIPVDTNGDLLPPLSVVVGNYTSNTFKRDWKVGDLAPTELSYKRSSSWPFDLMRIMALSKPAKFFNLAVNIDRYKYNIEFNQYLVDSRSHLTLADINVYGNGKPVTSYLNWIVDYEKQVGIDATTNVQTLLDNLDVRLVYRIAGFSDKDMLKFYVEKGNPNNTNASLLIPDESYQVLLYDNQPFDRIVYSGVVIQNVPTGYAVYGNSQIMAYFKVNKPLLDGKYETIEVDNLSVKMSVNYSTDEAIVPYGTIFYTPQEVADFLKGYGANLESKGMIFDDQINALEVNWNQIVAEFLYWAQTGWDVGTIVTLNPAAKSLKINRDGYIVQPLTLQQTNFVLNDNLYPIQSMDLSIVRNETLFNIRPLNQGDSLAYAQFNISNFEHGIVFNNVTLFNDVIYSLVTGLRQLRLLVKGTKTADWNGTVTASGFILNQDNIKEWVKDLNYTKGQIVKYKNRYWTALKVIQPKDTFDETDWQRTEYDQIQQGLLPNPSGRAYESTLYYDTSRPNLQNDADLLSFSLIGYRPRDYLGLADLTDITQVNVYQNMIKTKGTRLATDVFKKAQLPQGGIDYEIYENWAIKSGEFGSITNQNFVQFGLNETLLTGNPCIVGLIQDYTIPGVEQSVPLYKLTNYSTLITDPNILPQISPSEPSNIYPDAGYVNFNDVKMSSYFYSGMSSATNQNGSVVPLKELYVRDYAWLANYLEQWQVFTPKSLGQVINAKNNLNGTVTITFNNPHNLSQYQPFAVVNFSDIIDGYYLANSVVDQYNVIVSLTIDPATRNVTGQGIGLMFQSQRVAKPSDIANLPLLDSEFIKNKVWVDTNSDGNWAVYRKSINYQYDQELTKTSSQTFGSSVAYSDNAGIIVGDADAGEVYRYVFDPDTALWTVQQTITKVSSFGTAIARAGDMYAISQPSGSGAGVYIYRYVDTIGTTGLQFIQKISPVTGSVNWGKTLTMSGDQRYLFVSDYDNPITPNVVYVYSLSYPTTSTPTNAGSFVVGKSYIVTSVGSTDFTTVGASINMVGIVFNATGVGSGTGTAMLLPRYEFSSSIAIPTESYIPTPTLGDNFGAAIACSYSADTLAISAPNQAYDGTIHDWGWVYTYRKLSQNIEVQTTNTGPILQQLVLAVPPTQVKVNVISTAASTDEITIGAGSTTASLTAGSKIVFTGRNYLGSNIITDSVYYVLSVTGPYTFTITTDYDVGTLLQLGDTNQVVNAGSFVVGLKYTIVSVGTTNFVAIGASSNTIGVTFTATGAGSGTGTATNSIAVQQVATDPLYLTLNGSPISQNDYFVVDSNLYLPNTVEVIVNNQYVSKPVIAGDIVNASSDTFLLTQEVSSSSDLRVDIHFGTSLAVNDNGTEILIGSPYEIVNPTLEAAGQEGAVYRYTNGGNKFGVVVGTSLCNVVTPTKILINGYLVNIPAGDASTVANAINQHLIPNVESSSTTDGRLIISLVDGNLGIVNQKLDIVGLDEELFEQLGIVILTNTQIIYCPHKQGPTEFGNTIKFNEYDSIVVSAPTATRFEATTFDFVDDELDNDTIFDNNATQWIDSRPNAGAVYMFDYLSNYNESLTNIGKFIYAQCVNSLDEEYGLQPYYGQQLAFSGSTVVIGSPKYMPDVINGQVTVYKNQYGIPDWSVYRKSANIVDVSKLSNILIFSQETNNTLINLDYIDPLQGKILGVVRENIDFISNVDPARYGEGSNKSARTIWGAEFEGSVWLDTTNMRYVNYHQDGDVTYNGRYWATLFPGSDVAVYSWISSNVVPANYAGPGTPYNIQSYATQYVVSNTGNIVPVYFFWVRNTNIVFQKRGKTIADTTLEAYIKNPAKSGISYFAPLLPSTFAIYNSVEYINAKDSILNIGYSGSLTDDAVHNAYDLIRDNYPSDFLPGVPTYTSVNREPISLYAKLIDSLSGTDLTGGVVPDPFLPKALQTGVLTRPRQSFFLNRLAALKNYVQYMNEVFALYPFFEILDSTLIYQFGEFFDTTQYWDLVNWWAPGYNDSTKSSIQVATYADLSTLSVAQGTIVTVEANGKYGLSETYIYENSTWVRIGLTNGTIRIKDAIWNYADNGIGFGNNFFDTVPWDEYPSVETRYLVRAINEEIPADLLIYRNRALILLFDYIQSEALESQNYLTWLNKTSLIDVSHTIRELKPLPVYQSDNQNFLEGYLNETKPYHVVIKEFIFNYKGLDVFEGDLTDFDLPAAYNTTYEQFQSPQLVYSKPDLPGQYLPSNNIWQNPSYSQWFDNFGLSLTGEDGYHVCSLITYITLATKEFVVDNAFGLPINGIIRIGAELIGYTEIDRTYNIISGLTRGVDGTMIANHYPGELIYIDLPPVVLLNSGRGYAEPPKVTAYIDLSKYPAPREPAILSATMNVDKILSIDVINPGSGYAVTPEIIIEPAITATFASENISTLTSTIRIFRILETGDLVQYKVGFESTPVDGLIRDSWYYINVLEISPAVVVALYTTYLDAINDSNRIILKNQGTGTTHSLNVGGRAVAIASSLPVRENVLTLRYDRTTYNPRVITWEAGLYYGAYYAGRYSNSEKISSSSIQLMNTQPSIENILASASGAYFNIVAVESAQYISWSSLERKVRNTTSSKNSIVLTPLDDGSMNPNASGSTLGFFVNMPVKFYGAVGNSNIVNNQTYYVHSILNSIEFTISESIDGPIFVLGYQLISTAGLICSAGKVVNTAILQIEYPGILQVTATNSGTNTLTVPIYLNGTGGTTNFYIGTPVFFVGEIFGGVVENDVYYVTSILDKETFTISRSSKPLMLNVLSTNALTSTVMVDGVTDNIAINDPIVINNFLFDVSIDPLVNGQTYTIVDVGDTDWNTLAGTTGIVYLVGASFVYAGATGIVGTYGSVSSLVYGSINANQIYYLASKVDANKLTLSTSINGTIIPLISVTGYALLTSQADVEQLTTASGSMTMNVNLPISPGQITGQQFTLYETSGQFVGLTGDVTNLVEKNIVASLGGTSDRLVLRQSQIALYGIYVNMPFTVVNDIGGLTAGSTYYVVETGTTTIEVVQTLASATVAVVTGYTVGFELTVTSVVSGQLVYGAKITGTGLLANTTIDSQFSGTRGGIGVYVINKSQTVGSPGSPITITETASTLTTKNANDTDNLYAGMPVEFIGSVIGGVSFSTEYFVSGITNGNTFVLSSYKQGPYFPLVDSSGLGVMSGEKYIQASTTLAGSVLNLSTETKTVVMTQVIAAGNNAVFDVSYVLGGYRVLITDQGQGFAIDNTITIDGTSFGGASGTNDLIMTVETINDMGEILTVICSGTVPGQSNKYYLEAISSNRLAVYNDKTLTDPVSGINFPYTGFTTTTVTSTTNLTSPANNITVSDASKFSVSDRVIFTGTVASGLIEGEAYYILSISGNNIAVGTQAGITATWIDVGTSSVSFNMTKDGDYALLPEPFFFNQSVVKYKDNVYICIISNNDTHFVLGKWKKLDPADRQLNELDRIVGYYDPTPDMPGVNLQQLVTGITYPGSTYFGNPFAPDQQFELDTILPPVTFYPTSIGFKAVVYGANAYFAVYNTPLYSGVAAGLTNTSGEVDISWTIDRISNSVINVTDIIYQGGLYLMTSQNAATPIFRSNNGIDWTTNGYFTPFSADPWDSLPWDTTALSISSLYLNSVTYGGDNAFIAVGQNIVRSTDTYDWTEVFKFTYVEEKGKLTRSLNSVIYANLPGYVGYIAVGYGQTYDYSTGFTEIVNKSIMVTGNGILFHEIEPISYNAYNSVADNGTLAVLVGENGVKYYTYNGNTWLSINETKILSTNVILGPIYYIAVLNSAIFTVGEAIVYNGLNFGGLVNGTTYYISGIDVDSYNSLRLSSTPNLLTPVVLTTASAPGLATFHKIGITLNSIEYISQLSMFVAVGEYGRIETSSDGITWTAQTSGTLETLTGIANRTYVDVHSNYVTEIVVVGSNNTVLGSVDGGVTWVNASVLSQPESTYNIQGEAFDVGYGPEELVPGVVTDNMMMTVTTRPGTNWPATTYAHVGYSVNSTELTPLTPGQLTYSFAGVSLFPVRIGVFVITDTGLSYSIYNLVDYTIDWKHFTVTLNSTLDYGYKLRIDVYEPGNGDQLVSSNSKNIPVRFNDKSEFSEIYLNCNYSAPMFAGNGIIKPGTYPISVPVVQTFADSNELLCEDIKQLSLNDPIQFQGAVFGNIQENVFYYVKTISRATQTFTVSDTFSTVTGTPGPTYELVDAKGFMYTIIQTGIGTTWTEPLVCLNGNKLIPGITETVTETHAGENTVVVNSTLGMIVNSKITFSAEMFGGVLQGGVLEPTEIITGTSYRIGFLGDTDWNAIAGTTGISYVVGDVIVAANSGTGTGLATAVYYVKSLASLDYDEFTLSYVIDGPEVELTEATGGATFISNDYSFGIQPNGIQATLLLPGYYDSNDEEYISFTVFGETIPIQYGYTIPETQLITADGTVGPYTITNYMGQTNAENAIVEVNGIRMSLSTYNLDFNLLTITFDDPVADGSIIGITSYNLTERQYFKTNTYTNKTVSQISNISNKLYPYEAQSYVTDVLISGADAIITASLITGFATGQPVQFYGVSFGGIDTTNGTVYTVTSVNVGAGTFTISSAGLSNGSGSMLARAGGQETVRVTTAAPHLLSTNDLVRIDGIVGSVQLNNNLYYVHVINSIQFDLYQFNSDSPSTNYDPSLGGTNYPITVVSSYVSGGFVWLDQSYVLITTTVSATDGTTDSITVASTGELVVDTPVIFTDSTVAIGQETIGGIVTGQIYYIKLIDTETTFYISETPDGPVFPLSTDTGSAVVTQWSQSDVDRLWVTVNGYRVPSSSLRINPGNDISILTAVTASDTVIITSMMPSPTPNEQVFMMNVDKSQNAVVYRANPGSKTWLTKDLYITDTVIYVKNVSNITEISVQNNTVPLAVYGTYKIGLSVDKTLISNIVVYNTTTGQTIPSSQCSVSLIALVPYLVITEGPNISAGDQLVITVTLGNVMIINGEQIKFTTVDPINNTISGLSRGSNGTGAQYFVGEYTEVYSMLSSNRMINPDYYLTWNPIPGEYNAELGDPLQVANTNAANFLNQDNS